MDSEHEKLLHLLKTKKKRNYFRKLFQTIQDKKLFQNQPILPPENSVLEWRLEKRIKTIHVALCVCLNIGVDPPDVIKVEPCSKLECWVDTRKPKALEDIGNNLKTQFKRWQPRARYKHVLDGTSEDTEKTLKALRKSARKERVLFYYNGHGVPKPTHNGEIWVYNKDYTQYIPISINDLSSWMSYPAMYIFDCSHAGVLIKHFLNLAPQDTLDKQKDDLIILASCGPNEDLPTNADLPADLFTSCLTTPIKMALHWFLINNKLLKGRVTHDMIAQAIDYNHLKDRKTPFGELNWIFTAVTDTIAWSVLPQELFHKLFRQDLLLASMFRNYLLACRIMYSVNCTPQCYPPLPPTHNHPMWKAWDLVVDMCVSQLPEIKANPQYQYKFSNFFSSQLTDFEVWLTFSGRKTKPPAQLPILLQVLLSQEHRVRALKLIARFLDTSPSATNLVLSVGIFPYVVKLLQSGTKELRPILGFIWGKMLELDRTCQIDLVRDDGHIQFIRLLLNRDGDTSVWLRTIAAFVLSSICCKYPPGQIGCFNQNLLEIIKKELSIVNKNDTNLIKWLILCFAKMVEEYPAAQEAAVRVHLFDDMMKKFVTHDSPEIRACAVYALSCLVGKEPSAEEQQKKAAAAQAAVEQQKKNDSQRPKTRSMSRKPGDSDDDDEGSEQGSEDDEEEEEEDEDDSGTGTQTSSNKQPANQGRSSKQQNQDDEDEDDEDDGEEEEEDEDDENADNNNEDDEDDEDEDDDGDSEDGRTESRGFKGKSGSRNNDDENDEEEEEEDEEEVFRQQQQERQARKEKKTFTKHISIGSVLWSALEDPSSMVREETIYALAKIIRTYGDHVCPELIAHMIEDQEQKMMQCVLMASTSTIKSTTPTANNVQSVSSISSQKEQSISSSPPLSTAESLGSESETVSESSDNSFNNNEVYNNAKKLIRNSTALPFSSKEYLHLHRQKQLLEIEQQSMKHKAFNLGKNSKKKNEADKSDQQSQQPQSQQNEKQGSGTIVTSQYCDLRGRPLDRISFFTMDMIQLILMFCADPMVKVSDLAYSVLENIKENYLYTILTGADKDNLNPPAGIGINPSFSFANSPTNSINSNNSLNSSGYISNSNSSNNIGTLNSIGSNSTNNLLFNSSYNNNNINNSFKKFAQQQQQRSTPTQNLELLRNNPAGNASVANSKQQAASAAAASQKRASVKIQSGIGLTTSKQVVQSFYSPRTQAAWPVSILYEWCCSSFQQIRFQDESLILPPNNNGNSTLANSPQEKASQTSNFNNNSLNYSSYFGQQLPLNYQSLISEKTSKDNQLIDEQNSSATNLKPAQFQKLVQHEKLMISAVSAAATSGKKKIENQVGLFGNENNEIITKLLFHPFEDFLLSANESDSITVWDWVNQQKLKTINVSPVLKGRVSDFQIINENTDNPLLLVAGSSGNIAFFKNILTDSSEISMISPSAAGLISANDLSPISNISSSGILMNSEKLSSTSMFAGNPNSTQAALNLSTTSSASSSILSKFLSQKGSGAGAVTGGTNLTANVAGSGIGGQAPNVPLNNSSSTANSFLKIFPCYYNVAAGFSVLPGAEALYYNLEVDPVVAWQPAHSLLYVGGWGIGDVKIYDLVKEVCVSKIPVSKEKDFGTGVTAITTDIFGGGFVFGAGTNKGDVFLVDRRMKSINSPNSGGSLGSSPDIGNDLNYNSNYLHNTGNIVQKMQGSHRSYVVNITKQRITSFEVISASSSSDVHFWDTRLAGAPPSRTFSIQKGSLTAFAVHPFSPLFVSGSNSQFIKICNTAGETLSMIYYHEGFLGQRIGPVASLAWHPYKNLFACGCSDGIISLFR